MGPVRPLRLAAGAFLILLLMALAFLVAPAPAAKSPGKVIREQRATIAKQRQVIRALRVQVRSDTTTRIALMSPAELWPIVGAIAARVEAVAHEDYTVSSSVTTFDTYRGETFLFSWSGFNPAAALP